MKTMKAIVVVLSAVGILMMAATATPATVEKSTRCTYAKMKAATKLFHDYGKCRKKFEFAYDNLKTFDELGCDNAALIKCEEAFDRADQTYGVDCVSMGDGISRCNDVIDAYYSIEQWVY